MPKHKANGILGNVMQKRYRRPATDQALHLYHTRNIKYIQHLLSNIAWQVVLGIIAGFPLISCTPHVVGKYS